MSGYGQESLERLKSLHRDLVDLAESRLPNIERLRTELEARIDDFRNLLDKPSQNDQSRQAVSSGTVVIGDVEYTLNDEFKQDAIQVADFLGLNELDAVKLYFQAIEDAETLDRPALIRSVIIFHERRQFLLECLRLCLQIRHRGDADGDDINETFWTLINLVVQAGNGGESAFWRKCLEGMNDVEKWLLLLAERVQRVSMTDQTQSEAFAEIMEYQRDSLTRQHESLGVIAFYLVRCRYANVDGFRMLLGRLKRLDRFDVILVHYLPSLFGSVLTFGGHESDCSQNEARSLNHMLTSTKDNDAWTLRNFQAAASAIWLPEYSTRFLDQGASPSGQDAGSDADPIVRTSAFMDALRDGAFQFLLTVAHNVKANPWVDAFRQSLVSFLLQDAPALQTDSFEPEGYFQEVLLEQLQSFVESLITTMPDTLRDLKSEEDELRRQMHGRVQLRANEYELHLERFFVIVSLAFEGFVESSEAFWTDPDGNLFGFLQWASQRISTPHVATYCEMFRALSENESCADRAHKFLLEEGPSAPSKLRKTSPLSWNTIIRELEFYSSTIRERPTPQQGKPQADQYIEPESALMLECYLRLLSHLFKASPSARSWFLTHSSFHVHEHLLLLCGSSLESRLRACAFDALGALLTNKDREVGDGMWTALDAWVSGAASTVQRPPMLQGPSLSAENAVFDSISSGFEEPNAFVRLLEALVLPFDGDNALNDAIPFPESLGAAYRMPGIEPYVDFVLGRVFAVKPRELQDADQLRVVQCSCLNFVFACLSTFNEELVVFANQCSVSVDAAIRTSSLAAYARLHPYARIMEWVFNDAVISALFAVLKQDINEVNSSQSVSPLVVGVTRAIQIIQLVLSLQPTYFDIVRPIIKAQSASRKPVVANSALASFEDAILNHLSIVVKLGQYSSSGHQELAVVSLRLLQQLASSRKLSAPLHTGTGRQYEKSRLVTAMEKNGEVESISRSMILQMQLDTREFEQGPEYPGYVIKLEILKFLNACLSAAPDKPTVAHALLGFTCHSTSLEISESGLWAAGNSLFHAIVTYVANTPDGDGESLLSWCINIKVEATAILAKLVESHLSAHLVLPELRLHEFLFVQWIRQPKIDLDTPWDGWTIDTPAFFVADSGIGLLGFLFERNCLLDYVAMELRSAHNAGLATLKDRIKSTLLGTAPFMDGQQFPCVMLFDLLDFLELELGDGLPLPQTKFFNIQDLDVCKETSNSGSKYDLDAVEQLLLLRSTEIRKGGQPSVQGDEQQLQADADNILLVLCVNNRQIDIRAAHAKTLRSWVQLLIVVLDVCEFDRTQKNSVILQTLQLLLPRLEQSYSEDIEISILFAQLGKFILQQADFSSAANSSAAGNTVGDWLFQLFNVALAGIQNSAATASLRDICFQICHNYLQGISIQKTAAAQRQVALQSVKARGEKLIEIICDEASGGEGSCRIAALLLLGALVSTSNSVHSRWIIETLTRINFVQVLVHNIQNMPTELQDQNNSAEELLPYYNSGLSLLLRICQTRFGAAHVVDAGIFNSIRESRLFGADPDIGLELDNPKALQNYFSLLLAVLRILNAAVLSRGPENDRTIALARQFLHQSRSTMVAVVKRSARIGLGGANVGEENQELLEELSDAFTVLMVVSGFLDDEEENDRKTQTPKLFS